MFQKQNNFIKAKIIEIDIIIINIIKFEIGLDSRVSPD